jgi:3-phenylpropionate/trans-cinnamate dioxygenase ferredoxin subunit
MSENYIKAANLDDVPAGSMLPVVVMNKRLLLVNDNNTVYAIDEMCSHEDYSLSLGCIRDGRIKCSLHGSWFDLASGKPLEEPADEPICTYRTRVENGSILVAVDDNDE